MSNHLEGFTRIPVNRATFPKLPPDEQRLIDRYNELFEDGLRDWEKDPQQNMLDCINKRLADL